MTSLAAKFHRVRRAEGRDRDLDDEATDRDRRVQDHANRADEAIEQARSSIAEIRREMAFPFARSTRLEVDGDPGAVD